MSDLRDLHAHALQRATWQPSDTLRAACQDRTVFGTPKPPDHVNCGGHRCGCECHRPTPRERALWRAICDAIDDYLAPGENERAVVETADLLDLLGEDAS